MMETEKTVLQEQVKKLQRDNCQFAGDVLKLREENAQLQRKFDKEVS